MIVMIVRGCDDCDDCDDSGTISPMIRRDCKFEHKNFSPTGLLNKELPNDQGQCKANARPMTEANDPWANDQVQ